MSSWCRDCQRSFPNNLSLRQHLANSYAHNYCERCQRDFSTPHALAQHKANSSFHNACGKCGDDYVHADDLDDHIEECHWYCRKCSIFVNSKDELTRHFVNSSAHHYCGPCERAFQSESNLASHLRSTIHAGKTIRCVGCVRTFPTISAMTIHLESGTCVSGATRKKLNNTIRANDPNHIITERLLTYPGSNGSSNVRTWATNAAWNGSAFECYFCDREFRSLTALNQHLQSPAHEQKLYKCPKCNLKFNLFSGLVQHVESESCGIARFREVKMVMDRMTSSLSRMIIF